MFLSLVDVGSPTHPSHRDCQLVRETIYYGWSDSSLIAGDLISPTNSS